MQKEYYLYIFKIQIHFCPRIFWILELVSSIFPHAAFRLEMKNKIKAFLISNCFLTFIEQITEQKPLNKPKWNSSMQIMVFL